jgi:4,5-dihydroxyphthalate decarboxylase
MPADMTTLAIERYDRHFPFFDGTVSLPPGLKDLKVLQLGQETMLRDGGHRHSRMLKDGEFDAAETSLSSYVAAKAKGLPFTAIPVFPRRLFSQGQMFVNVDSGIETPADLEGKTVGLQSFQTTLAVLAKGDVALDHGVDLRAVKWRLRNADTVKVEYDPAFDIEKLPDGADLGTLLAEGGIDALFYSRTPVPKKPGLEGRIRRLHADPRAEEKKYVARHGYWPIMHIVALNDRSVEKNPELPMQLMAAFDDAMKVAHTYLNDPNWSRLAWTKYIKEEEDAAFPQSLWTSGVAANRANLDCFIGYALDQGSIDHRLAVEDLFHPSVHNT